MSYKLADLRTQQKARDPQRMLENLADDLALRFSVGIWYFTPGGGRFHDRFVEEASLEERLEMAAEVAELGSRDCRTSGSSTAICDPPSTAASWRKS